MDTTPIIPQKPPPLPSAKKPFAFQAAQASLLSPLVSVVTSVVVNGGDGQLPPVAKIISASACILLILLGFVFGMIALFGVSRHGKKGILGKAIAGVCINGILIVFMIVSIPLYKKMAERAKQSQQQQMEQQQTRQ